MRGTLPEEALLCDRSSALRNCEDEGLLLYGSDETESGRRFESGVAVFRESGLEYEYVPDAFLIDAVSASCMSFRGGLMLTGLAGASRISGRSRRGTDWRCRVGEDGSSTRLIEPRVGEVGVGYSSWAMIRCEWMSREVGYG